jgi:autotransporter-associated beta strand protein
MRSVVTTPIFFFAVFLIAAQLAQGDNSAWNLDPTSSDWNTAVNWTPASVPNAPDVTAIFDVSNTTNVSLSGRTTVGEIIFNPGASAFTITAPDQMADALSIVGAGLSNQSGIKQALVAPEFGTFLGLPTVIFKGTALAGDLITLTASPLGGIRFQESSGADHATIVGAEQSAIVFAGKSNAGSASITASGTDQASSYGSEVDFIAHSDAANAILTAESGSGGGGGGGRVYFTDDSSGGLAQVRVFGNGTLLTDHNDPGVTIGSLEGDGTVSIGLGTLSIGSNGRDTVFSGVIQDFTYPSPLRKIGDGTLHLKGASTYTAGTTIDGGQLLAENTVGSALGTGPVQVNSGTLGGKGIIAGAVTVGTNTNTLAFLAPSKGAKKPATLTIQGALTLNDDSAHIYKLDTKRVKADEVIANGVVIDSGAKFSLRPSGNNALAVGQVFTVISNTSASPIAGTFHNLADRAIVNVNGNNLQVSYSGGDGNDLTLTVVP